MKALRSKTRVKAALLQQFAGVTDQNGYVDTPEQNLVHGVRLDQFQDDLRRGDGNELKTKFRAVHSSAALAVNTFAPFKDRPQDLTFFGRQGAVGIQFEKQMPIIPGRRPSNLDVWIDLGTTAVAVESKFLEYFDPKKPTFADAYKSMESVAEPCWWATCLEAWGGKAQQLDLAQLIKHYFGLRQFQKKSEAPTKLLLLYLFWEPLNWESFPECQQHRSELEQLSGKVQSSVIEFRWMTYSQLWSEWVSQSLLAEHTLNLKARYEISV
jgi:hypothetical protein